MIFRTSRLLFASALAGLALVAAAPVDAKPLSPSGSFMSTETGVGPALARGDDCLLLRTCLDGGTVLATKTCIGPAYAKPIIWGAANPFGGEAIYPDTEEGYGDQRDRLALPLKGDALAEIVWFSPPLATAGRVGLVAGASIKELGGLDGGTEF